MKTRIVIDTNVMLSALRSSKGASYALVSQLPLEYFQVALSVPLYTEYQDVLTRDEHMTGASSKAEILQFLRYICGITSHHDIFFLWRPWLSDPKDDMVLELAVASSSRYIVTHNLRDFANIDTFGIEAITPGRFLELLRGQTS